MQRCLQVLFCLFLLFGACPQTTFAQDLDLRGTIAHGADVYVLVPFEVPAGIKRLDVSFSYTGREDHTTLDLGLLDSQRFRGWSGGNKSAFTEVRDANEQLPRTSR